MSLYQCKSIEKTKKKLKKPKGPNPNHSKTIEKTKKNQTNLRFGRHQAQTGSWVRCWKHSRTFEKTKKNQKNLRVPAQTIAKPLKKPKTNQQKLKIW